MGLRGFEPPATCLGNRCSILLSYNPILKANFIINEKNSLTIEQCNVN